MKADAFDKRLARKRERDTLRGDNDEQAGWCLNKKPPVWAVFCFTSGNRPESSYFGYRSSICYFLLVRSRLPAICFFPACCGSTLPPRLRMRCDNATLGSWADPVT